MIGNAPQTALDFNSPNLQSRLRPMPRPKASSAELFSDDSIRQIAANLNSRLYVLLGLS